MLRRELPIPTLEQRQKPHREFKLRNLGQACVKTVEFLVNAEKRFPVLQRHHVDYGIQQLLHDDIRVEGVGWEAFVISDNETEDSIYKVMRETIGLDSPRQQQCLSRYESEEIQYCEIYEDMVIPTDYDFDIVSLKHGWVDVVVGRQQRVHGEPLFDGRRLSQQIETFSLEELTQFYHRTAEAYREGIAPDISGTNDILIDNSKQELCLVDARVIRTANDMREAFSRRMQWPSIAIERINHLGSYLAKKDAITQTHASNTFHDIASVAHAN